MEKETKTKRDQSTVISRVNQRILSWQKRLADHLNLKCRNISSKGLLAMLISFIVITAAVLLNLIICAIH